MTDPVTPEPGMQTWHSPHGTTWEAETYEEALEAERDSLAAQLEAAQKVIEAARKLTADSRNEEEWLALAESLVDYYAAYDEQVKQAEKRGN